MGSQLFNFNKSRNTNPQVPSSGDKTKRLVLDTTTFQRLRSVIYDLSGIYFTDNKKYLLEDRIGKRIIKRDLKTFNEYIDLLNSNDSKQELHHLFSVITINETYFFRANQQFEALEEIVIPEIYKLRSQSSRNPILRFWSAASSSGEEAYTLAMLLLEKIKPRFPNVQFQIIGSDISNKIIQDARAAIYKEYAIRFVPPNYMKKYFTKEGNNYILNNEVKKMVRFVNLNLYDQSAMRTMKNCDVVMCANVLIYFDIPSKQKVVSYLFDSLNKGGYLFIGYSESLHGISKAFKLVHLPKAMAYKKE